MGTHPPIGRRTARSTRDQRARLGGGEIALAVVCLTLLLGASAASAAPSGAVVQPPGATFEVAFPGPPHVALARPGSKPAAPGERALIAYYVSNDPAPLLSSSSNALPRTPTYFVLQMTFGSSVSAEHFVSKLGRTPGLKPVLVGSVAGYRFVGREKSPINKHNRVTQPHAYESALAVSQADTAYVAIAYTRHRAAAASFTHSMQIVGGTAGTVPPPLDGTAGAQPQFGQVVSAHHGSTAYKTGGYVGAALVAVSLIALVLRSQGAKRPRRSVGSGPQYGGPQYGGPQYGGPPTGAGPAAASSQFAWMYDAPPAQPPTVAAVPPPQPPAAAVPPPPPAGPAAPWTPPSTWAPPAQGPPPPVPPPT
jgi:hypothetical protein